MELTAGDSFGERAIMYGQPRAASILCKTNCHFAVMDFFDYKRTLDKLIE